MHQDEVKQGPLLHKPLDRALQWHPSLNVYLMGNRDVLLISPAQQTYLPAIKFPLLHQIDGTKNTSQILAVAYNNDVQQRALICYQINQLLDVKTLVYADSIERYIRPDFDRARPDEDFNHLQLNKTIKVINLSAATEAFLAEIASMLLQIISDNKHKIAIERLAQVILVDDFIDPRILPWVLDDKCLLIKITGDALWVSPVLQCSETFSFERLQQCILDNQPVRKTLMATMPNQTHGFSFQANQPFRNDEKREICALVSQQWLTETNHQLVIYDRLKNKVESHFIQCGLGVKNSLSNQLNRPVILHQCISHFNHDGGSRNIMAEATVAKLLPFVSPVTGIINHLTEVKAKSDGPVKIYRTGFFKAPSKDQSFRFDQDCFVQICLGKGVSPEQSKASALSEAIERYCALYQDDVPNIISTQSALTESGKRSVSFQDLVPYSGQQYQLFNDGFCVESTLKQAARPYNDEAIHWLPTWSLTHEERVYVPLSQCFSNIPYDDDQFGRWHSNGCAAGNTLEEAILQGLFELIERDAAGIWWYNQITLPLFDLNLMDQDNLEKLKDTLSPSHDFWALDLTNDLGIPVMAAIGRDKKSAGWILGFGCHLIPAMAAQRALTELCQLIPIRNHNSAPFDFDAIEEGAYLYGNPNTKVCPPVVASNGDIKDDILAIVARLNQLNFETLILDYSREPIPLNTAKVFVPGLCHIWPQLGSERLYRAPVSLGWLNEPNNEAGINPLALYV